MAYASGLTDSAVSTAIYTIVAAAPTFSPAGGTLQHWNRRPRNPSTHGIGLTPSLQA